MNGFKKDMATMTGPLLGKCHEDDFLRIGDAVNTRHEFTTNQLSLRASVIHSNLKIRAHRIIPQFNYPHFQNQQG